MDNIWSKFLLAATKSPRMLGSMFGIANPESYTTQKEQDQTEQAKSFLLNALVETTKPFAKGANILAQGYGDLYRGLSGKTDYVSPFEQYVRSGITQDEQQKIEDTPYLEMLKSGAGMAATLAPMSTAGTFTNAATRGTRAFAGVNPSSNSLVNQLSQIALRGSLEGTLGGFGYSRAGKELQDTLTGAGLGIGGELIGEYATNKSFRDMLNEGVKEAYQSGIRVDPQTGRKYFTAGTNLPNKLAGNDLSDLSYMRAKAIESAGLDRKTINELDAFYEGIEGRDFLKDIELLRGGSVEKTPAIRDYLLELRQRGLVDPDQVDLLLKADYGIDPNDLPDFHQMRGDPENILTDTRGGDAEVINAEEWSNAPIYEDGDKAYSDLLKSAGQESSVDFVTEQPIKVYRGEGKGIGNTTFVEGKYLADSKDFASTFGDVKEYTIPKGAKVFDFDTIKGNPNQDIIPQKLLVDPGELTDYLIDKGYDYTKNTNTRGVEYVELNKTHRDLRQLAKSSKNYGDFVERMLDSWDKYRDEINRIESGFNTAERYQYRSVLDYIWEKIRGARR